MPNIFADVLIIGAGPAGLFTAINIEAKNRQIIILEKNQCAGKKLLLTGNGKCNITNSAAISDFFDYYNHKARKFIRKALFNFDNIALQNFFRNYDIEFYADADNRIIPKNANAEKIRNILIDCCKAKNIKIHYDEPANKIEIITQNAKKKFCVYTDKNIYFADKLVLSTGGCSYPQTGSTGDGYKFAEALGHAIITPKPALSQIFIKDFQLSDIAGSSLKTARLIFFRASKKIAELTGEILITHKGLSGIPVINISREISSGDTIIISFIDNQQLKFTNNFKQLLHTNQKKSLKSILKKFELSERLIEKMLALASIKTDILVYQISKEEKERLLKTLTHFEMTVLSSGDFNTAMITAGGIALNEINPATMESLIIPNLYFAGEILDIDGFSGGFNLQAAFSTAKLAASNI